jgi:hypothetical protein
VFSGIEGGRAFFDRLKDLRDAFVAHRFGPLRQCDVGVIVDLHGNVVEVGYLWHTAYAFGKAQENDVLTAFSVAERYLDAKVKELQERLRAEAASLSREQLLALESAKTYGIASDELRISRSELQARRSGKTTPSGRSPRRRKR